MTHPYGPPVPVVWLNFHPHVCDTPGMWDQTMIEALLRDRGGVWDRMDPARFPHDRDTGIVVVIPGGFHADDVDAINQMLALYPRVLVIVTSDERGDFRYEGLEHPDMRLWVMTPRPGRGPFNLGLPEGWQPGTRDILAEGHGPGGGAQPWVFWGQVNHPRRQQMAAAVETLTGPLAATDSAWRVTGGFAQGDPQRDYLAALHRTRVALAPSGPRTVDSFRCYEALEAGALPLVDVMCPEYGPGYWETLFGETPPFVIAHDWPSLPGLLSEAISGWPVNANRASAWWQRWKAKLRTEWDTAREWLTGEQARPDVTVLVPVSPIESHPDTACLDITVASIRHHLPDAPIVLMFDGVRPQQEHRRADYEQFMRAALWKANHEWGETVPLVFDTHSHQSGMTRAALNLVRSPTILFVEHDTPLETDRIPWAELVDGITAGDVDLVRFHHESEVLDVHQHLMLDTIPQPVHGAPLLRTVQWSQRPHLASTAYYRRIIDTYFAPGARTFIEDVMHGVVQAAYGRDGLGGWHQHRLWMFAPMGGMRRSYHLDGRGSEPKYDMTFAYPGDTPFGAPAP